MTSATPSLPSPQQPALSQVERVIDTFIAPTKTFTDLRRSASWWLPWLLGALAGLAMVTVVDRRIGMEKVFENQMAQTPKKATKLDQLSPDERAAQVAMAAKVTRGIAFSVPVMSLIFMGIIAGVLMTTFNFGLGASLTFHQCMAVTAYAYLPGILKALIAIVAILVGGGESFTFQNPVASNLSALVDPSSPFLYSVATSLDIFTIWILALMGIGYSCLTRLKRGACLGVVFGWWAVTVLVSAGFAAM